MKRAIFTIVSNNYLHFARAMLKSAREVHPEADLFCVIVDRDVRPAEDLASEFTPLFVDDLDLPDRQQFLFRYNVLELNTAVKPWGFGYLLDHRYDEVIYVDPDIWLYRPLDEVMLLFSAGSNIVMTPHLLAPIEDALSPSELDIRRAGTYNFGFCAVRAADETRKFIRWWQSKLERGCVVALDKGIFVDQSWMDLVPGLFDGVSILRHPGYNVAYWNLAQREVSERDGQWFVDGQPLVFFHFSGLDPLKPDNFSKHQNRFTLKDLGAVRKLVAQYVGTLLQMGAREYSRFAYGFDQFESGQLIPNFLRIFYRETPAFERAMGEDPFRRAASVNETAKTVDAVPITWAMLAYWSHRVDVQGLFPLTSDESVRAFRSWFEGDDASVFTRSTISPGSRGSSTSLHKDAADSSSKLPSGERGPSPIDPGIPASDNAVHADRLVGLVQMLFYTILGRFAEPEAVTVYRRIAAKPYGGLRVWRALAKSKENRRRPGWLARSAKGLKIAWSGEAFATAMGPSGGAAARRDGQIDRPIPGVNIVGYVKAELGVGQAARSLASAAQAAGIEYALVDVGYQSLNRQTDDSALGLASEKKQPIDVLYVNADQTPETLRFLAEKGHNSRLRIGNWHWEQPSLPSRFLPSFAGLAEVWVPTAFVQQAVSAIAPCPVVKISNAVDFAIPEAPDRKKFGLPHGKFLVLVMYDFASHQFRKNPQAAIDAFRQLASKNAGAALVVKTVNAQHHPDDFRDLERSLADLPDVVLITDFLSRGDVYELQACCDVLLSLHRAEGFGLALAEMMFLGRPVVATGWSGNMDFMTPMNSYPVEYALKPLESSSGVYEAGQLWAEADVDHAAWCLGKLMQEPAEAKAMGRRAAASIRATHAPDVIGAVMKHRLELVSRLHGLT